MSDGGRPVALGTGRQRALLCCLLLRANEAVSRDVLIEALWGERPTATAANALQVQVHGLRRRLGRERIETAAAGYVLRVEPDELDLDRFERLVARGRGSLAAGDAEEAAATLRAALALWRGQALADVAYDSFALADVARLEELRLAALEERIEADLALARHVELVPELEALAAEHPLRERLQSQLMLALYRSGRQAEALDAYQRVRRALDEELGLEPGPALKELQQSMLRQDFTLLVEPPELRARRHLPAPLTPLVGRRRELAELLSLVRGDGLRLVTLTGPGGTGKTRLAVEAAHRLADAFVDGVHFVDLAPLHDPELVLPEIASALGVEAEALADATRDRRLLLLLDNFEAVDDAAPLLAQLLARAPELALLVTSRAPLRLSGEHEYRLAPLPLDDAIRLFVARAGAAAPEHRRPREDDAAVAEICRRLDCLPLAIELAAARTRELATAELLPLLPRPLELARDAPRDLPARHRTLRATIDWSYELLQPAERQLFVRLAVFAGGCTADAAAETLGATRLDLAALVGKSLLRERPDAGGAPRFTMLETIRAYAVERLDASPEAEALRGRHARLSLALAEASEEAIGAGAEARPWLDRLAAEHDNFRAALEWAHEAEPALALRLASALRYLWHLRGHLSEGRRWLDATLARAGEDDTRARAKGLFVAEVLAYIQADVAAAKRLGGESLALYRQLGDPIGIGRTLGDLGIIAATEGDHARARELFDEASAIFRAERDELRLAQVIANLGDLALKEGEYDEAARLLAEGAELQRAIGDKDGASVSVFTLGRVALLQDARERAAELFAESLRLSLEIGYPEVAGYALTGLGQVELAAGDPMRAARLLAASEAILEQTGAVLQPSERELHDEAVARAGRALGEERFAAAWAEGRSLDLDRAAAEALQLRV